MSQRLPFLDFAKGRAIVTILLFHFLRHIDGLPYWCQLVLMMGGAGVHIFFLVSGISLTIWRGKQEETGRNGKKQEETGRN
jgi:peptidoglycan/LPS O-acetylase OafA/YrhL